MILGYEKQGILCHRKQWSTLKGESNMFVLLNYLSLALEILAKGRMCAS